MSAEKPGWNFPSSGGGTEAGFNDSGIETYAGKPFESLAREIIQNSLDAHLSQTNKPVIVSFDAQAIKSAEFPGHDEMLKIMKQCLQSCKGDDKEERFFENATRALLSEKINCLKVSDYNTTGLRDGTKGQGYKSGQWHRLVKTTGRSAKDSKTAGGSYGIGKNAPYVVSSLRTVFYSTRFKDGGKIKEYAQGKSILVSHELPNGEYSQAIGYYGVKEGCERLEGDKIPDILRLEDRQHGTTVFIPGLVASDIWQEKIMAAIVSNYFDAIHEKLLKIRVEGDEIDAQTLPKWFAEKRVQNAGGKEMKRARDYYEAIIANGEKENFCRREFEVKGLGRCSLRIIKDGDYSKRVAILRRGMKITDDMSNLVRWSPAWDGFAAVCKCENDKGNALLRSMESPEHDKFQPDRLEIEKVKMGRQALSEFTDKIRKEIEKFVANFEKRASIRTGPMAEFFPDNEDKLPGEKNPERAFGGAVKIEMKPRKISLIRRRLGENEDEEEDPGKNLRKRRKRTKKPSNLKNKTEPEFPISAVRVIPVNGDDQSKILKFTALKSGRAKLSLSVAGDSFPEEIPISAVGEHKDACVKNDRVICGLTENDRVTMRVTLKEPINDAALSISLAELKEIKR